MKDTVHPFALHREDGATRLNQIGFLLMFLPAVFGAQEVAGFGRDPEVDRLFVFALGLLGGALASTGGLVLIHFVISGRERFFFIEAVVFWLVGSFPGALAYKALLDRSVRARRTH